MNTKTCDSCGKDYPIETNTFCPECFTTESEALKYDIENGTHTHTYYLVQDSFSKQQYHRECKCGHKTKCTKYKVEL